MRSTPFTHRAQSLEALSVDAADDVEGSYRIACEATLSQMGSAGVKGGGRGCGGTAVAAVCLLSDALVRDTFLADSPDQASPQLTA